MSSAAAAGSVPDLPQVTLIPDGSQLPFGSARSPGANFIDLDRYGYVEEELYVAGKAAVRDEQGAVVLPAAPYTTRLLIRRPKDSKSFSGTVIVTPFNWAGETAREWGFIKFYLAGKGDVFVGVTNVKQQINGFPGKNGIRMLQEYDATRYGSLSVHDDHSDKRSDMPQGQDLLAQLAWLLKSNLASSPLKGMKVQRVIAFAEGVQADVFQHYVAQGRHNEFRMPNGKPLYDAYLLGAYHLLPPPEERQRPDAAYVIVQHQREIHRYAKAQIVAPADSDKPLFRLYDFVGSAHMGAVPVSSYGELTLKLDAPQSTPMVAPGPPGPPPPGGAARPPRPTVCSSGNTEPSGLVFIALLDGLKRWISTGKPLPHAPRVARDAEGERIDPVTGNAMGGLRPPWVVVPAASYLTGDVVGCGPFEPMTIYAAEKLQSLYGSYDAYLHKFDAAKAAFIKAGFLLPENAADLHPTVDRSRFGGPQAASGQKSMSDLSGVWWSKTFDSAWLPMDGKPIPFTPTGRKAYEDALLEIKSGKREDLATERCIPQGVPRILSAPYPFQIVQRQDIVAVIHEITHATQLVFMNQAQPAPDDVNESFMGHSVGRWDGATLVIDTVGLKDNWMDGTGLPHSDKLHVVQRLRKINGGRQLENLITIEDPDLFTHPWTARRVHESRPDVSLMEYVCGEANRDISSVVTVKRGGH